MAMTVLAVMSVIFLLCTAGLFLPSLSAAYSLRQSERILSGLEKRPLRLERDEILRKEKRVYINNLLVHRDEDGAQLQRSEYGVVTLERAGTYAVGKGKDYLAPNLKDYTLLPESGPVWLVHVPELEQPYALVVTKEDQP